MPIKSGYVRLGLLPVLITLLSENAEWIDTAKNLILLFLIIVFVVFLF